MSKPLLPAEKEVLLWQDKNEKAVLKMLEKHYKDALKDIDEKITAMMGRQDANLPNVIRRIEYQRMLKEQLQTALERLHSNEYETISDYLKESYTDAFVGTMYTLHKQDVPIILPVDQSVVVKAVTIDSKLKESLYSSIGKDITQLKKTIAAEITRGIATGMMYNDIARNIRNTASIPMRRAKSIARTEAGRVQEQATFDAAKGAKAKGADVVKQWSSFRDGKTRDAHRKLDGQVRELDEPFEVNGKKAMHPHDFGVAELDINCRCTMLTRARAALDEDDLKLMTERAATHRLLVKDKKGFDGTKVKDFSDFKKKYLKAAETLEKQGKSGIIKADKTISGHAGTPKKAEPNTVIDHVDEKGSVDARGFYGDDGFKGKDIHTTDHGNPKRHPFGKHGEHAHDYKWDDDGRLKEKTTRNLNEDEKEGNGDIL